MGIMLFGGCVSPKKEMMENAVKPWGHVYMRCMKNGYEKESCVEVWVYFDADDFMRRLHANICRTE